ncbi:alpha-tocopherol transfer protein-like [Calliphora vicina]|uniref:alpha-tocopherol transfer protein-like n=1 Tax=Calliphora vicina TaxID=7373 RepID=UPI00325AAF86
MENNRKTSPEIKCGDLILKLDLGKPSETAQKKALKELRETSENIQKGIYELKRLLQAETDLIIPQDNEEWLIKYLRPCKFYPESARDLVRRHYNLRHKYKEITNVLKPFKLKQVFDANMVTILPQRDQHGRRIIMSLMGKQCDYNILPYDIMYAAGTLCTDLLQLEPETQINGVVYIVDLQGLSFSQALQHTPYRNKRVLDYIQNNIPLRVKGFHVVNQPKIFEPIFAAIKLFFNSKYAERIQLHGSNYKSLHRYVSAECLPQCYGGTMKTELMYGRETYQLLSHFEEYFEDIKHWSNGSFKYQIKTTTPSSQNVFKKMSEMETEIDTTENQIPADTDGFPEHATKYISTTKNVLRM